MSAGRFRVKSGADRATADALMRDLSSVGAACLLVDEGGNVVARAPVGVPVPRLASTVSDGVDAVTITDRPPPRRESSNDATRPYVPPIAGLGAGPGAGPHSPTAAPNRPDARPDARAHAIRGGVSLAHSPLDRVRGKLADIPRLRFAVGVFAIVLLGFLPAMIFAQIRAGALDDVDDEVRAEQALVRDLDGWNRLDDIRSSMEERKRSLRASIAVGGVLIWALCGAGVAFFWFRKIDWEFYRSAQVAPPAPMPSPYHPGGPGPMGP